MARATRPGSLVGCKRAAPAHSLSARLAVGERGNDNAARSTGYTTHHAHLKMAEKCRDRCRPVFAGGLAIGASQFAGAASPPSISQVEKKVNALQSSYDKDVQQYDAASTKLTAAKARLHQVNAEVAVDNGRYQSARKKVVEIAAANYEDSGQTSLAGLLTSSDPAPSSARRRSSPNSPVPGTSRPRTSSPMPSSSRRSSRSRATTSMASSRSPTSRRRFATWPRRRLI